MPQFLKFILYSLLPGFFINSYICVLFCAGILTPSRIFFSKNRIRFFLSFMIPITAAGMSKYWFPSMGSWLIQLTVLLLTILYFSDPLKKKISTFLILICILAVSENIAATFALPIYTLIHHEESFRYNLLYTCNDRAIKPLSERKVIPGIYIGVIECDLKDVTAKSEFPLRSVEDVPFLNVYEQEDDEVPFDISDIIADRKARRDK